MNQSQFLAITCNLLEAREKSRVQGAIGFGFASRWLKNWRESFKPITKRSNRNHVITFDSHLKSALLYQSYDVLISFNKAASDHATTLETNQFPFSMSDHFFFSRGYAKRRKKLFLGLRICNFFTHSNVNKSICQRQMNWQRLFELMPTVPRGRNDSFRRIKSSIVYRLHMKKLI